MTAVSDKIVCGKLCRNIKIVRDRLSLNGQNVCAELHLNENVSADCILEFNKFAANYYVEKFEINSADADKIFAAITLCTIYPSQIALSTKNLLFDDVPQIVSFGVHDGVCYLCGDCRVFLRKIA